MPALAKLRQGIAELNAEGRERLLAAFEVIDGHFRALFTTLFDGGQAELRLIESDDPLEAGLEIYACPPGKRLAVMSLMSGGEQALTAAALIFAVFLANPAPICVLDEVDAPLDDANVERFCNLLDEMRRRAPTRFVTITHNPLTMSRMDRLYGVTMPERGSRSWSRRPAPGRGDGRAIAMAVREDQLRPGGRWGLDRGRLPGAEPDPRRRGSRRGAQPCRGRVARRTARTGSATRWSRSSRRGRGYVQRCLAHALSAIRRARAIRRSATW